ncbi:unnamed protein product [Lampetra planeri]
MRLRVVRRAHRFGTAPDVSLRVPREITERQLEPLDVAPSDTRFQILKEGEEGRRSKPASESHGSRERPTRPPSRELCPALTKGLLTSPAASTRQQHKHTGIAGELHLQHDAKRQLAQVTHSHAASAGERISRNQWA